jgi:hypothetical protein
MVVEEADILADRLMCYLTRIHPLYAIVNILVEWV